MPYSNQPAASDSVAIDSCFHLGTPTLGVAAAFFACGLSCQHFAAPFFAYVYQPFVPGIGLQGGLQVSSGCVNVRETAGLSGRIVSCIGKGTATIVKVDGGPNYVDQKLWWHLEGLGWMAHEFLICAKPGPSDGLLSAQC